MTHDNLKIFMFNLLKGACLKLMHVVGINYGAVDTINTYNKNYSNEACVYRLKCPI